MLLLFRERAIRNLLPRKRKWPLQAAGDVPAKTKTKNNWQKQLASRALRPTGAETKAQAWGQRQGRRDQGNCFLPVCLCPGLRTESEEPRKLLCIEQALVSWSPQTLPGGRRKSHEAFMKERLPRPQLGYQQIKKNVNVNTHSGFAVLMFQTAPQLGDNIKEADKLWRLGGGWGAGGEWPAEKAVLINMHCLQKWCVCACMWTNSFNTQFWPVYLPLIGKQVFSWWSIWQ